MINEERVQLYCSEPLHMIENYDKAIADMTQTWDCHHRLEIQGQLTNSMELLKKCGMYYHVKASQLLFLPRGEHMRLHAINSSDSTRNRISSANTGKHHSDETRIKMSESHKGKPKSDETRRKMSEAQKGNTHWLGKHHTYDTKRKLSESKKGDKNPQYGKHPSAETLRKRSESLKLAWQRRKREG